MLVGFTSSVAIVFQAALAFNATPAQIASWMWALGIGMGLCTVLLSLFYKKPIMVAWSTPGAAVLATAGVAGGFIMGQAVGAFMVSAVLITLFGITGWFEKLMNRIPVTIASALLAGVLARFGMQGLTAAQSTSPLVLMMLAIYLLARHWLPRYAVVLTLLGGVAYAAATGQMAWSSVTFSFAMPVFVMLQFTLPAIVSLAIPLFVVTMASQNLPGLAAIRATGYQDSIPVSNVITITAAIVMGKEAHPDPDKRYTAAVSCGLIYLVIGIFGVALTSLLAAFPKELVAAIAGLALLGTIGGGLAAAVKDESHREAGLITFLVTLSAVVIAGIDSAFWGVVAGALARFVQQYGQAKPQY